MRKYKLVIEDNFIISAKNNVSSIIQSNLVNLLNIQKIGGSDDKAGVLLYDNINKKILTVSNEDDHDIGIPKGSVNKGESSLEAGFRELKEETGIIFQDLPKIVDTFEFKFNKSNIIIYVVLFPNGSTIDHHYIAPSEHIYNVKWRTKTDIITNIEHVNTTIRKKNYLSDRIIKLFDTNYTDTILPLVTLVNHELDINDPNLNAFVSVETKYV